MLDWEINNRIYSYAFYVMATATFLLGLVSGGYYLAALSAALLLVAAVYFRSGHILNNLLLKKGRVIEVYNGYTLSDDLAAAVKRASNGYVAVSCVLLSGGAAERNGEHIEAMVTKTDFPFEFSLGLRSVDHGRVLDGLEERRRLKEIEIARSDPKNYDKVNGLRRELSVIDNEIRSVRGEKLLAMKMRLRTFAKSWSATEAAREAVRNAGFISGSFSSTLGLEHEILMGERLLNELEAEGDLE